MYISLNIYINLSEILTGKFHTSLSIYKKYEYIVLKYEKEQELIFSNFFISLIAIDFCIINNCSYNTYIIDV